MVGETETEAEPAGIATLCKNGHVTGRYANGVCIGCQAGRRRRWYDSGGKKKQVEYNQEYRKDDAVYYASKAK